MKGRLLGFVVAMLISVIALGQNDQMKFKPSIMVGYFGGARVSANQEDYVSGNAYYFMVTREWRKGMEAGISLGLQASSNERFFPFTFQLKASRNPERPLGFLVGFGYSGAEGDYEQDNERYELEGGFYMEIGARWHYDLSNSFRLKPQITLSRQTSRDEFKDGVLPTVRIIQDRNSINIGVALELQG